MRRLGSGPRLVHFLRQIPGVIDSWFNQVTERFNLIQLTSSPTETDVPYNQWAIFKNTSSNIVRLAANDAGTLKHIDLDIIGGGNVTGPATSVNNNVVLFDGVNGRLLKDSGLTLAGTNTGDQTSIVGITGSLAEFNTALTGADFATGGGTATGTNTGDQFTSVTASKLLGRGDSGAGAAEEITVGPGLVIMGTTISAVGGGTGDVVGPASAVNNRVVFFDGITGKLIKDSGLTLSGSNTGDQTSIVGITGTLAQFNTACTDADFASLAGSEILTNKTINGAVINSTSTFSIRNSGVGAFDFFQTYNDTLTANRTLQWDLNNVSRSITLSGDLNLAESLTTLGAFPSSFTFTGSTAVTFPVAGTLSTLAGAEAFTNKSYAGSTVTMTGAITSSGGGVGYTTGAGGTVVQATNKGTGVTLNKLTGQITMAGTALAAGAIVSFTFTNSFITNTDLLLINHVTTGTGAAYTINANCGSGTAVVAVRNNTAGSLSEAIVLRFAVIKAVTS
jgi:hypothetical protein